MVDMIWYNVCIVYANNRFSLPVKDFMIILIARKVVHHYWSRFINFSQNFISNRLQESSTLFGSFSSASRIKVLQTQAVRNPYFSSSQEGQKYHSFVSVDLPTNTTYVEMCFLWELLKLFTRTTKNGQNTCKRQFKYIKRQLCAVWGLM